MIDSLRRVLEYAIGYLDIVPDSASTDADIAAIAQMIAAYDALAPKPDAWPDGAQWYTIDAENQCYWHIDEPALFDWAWDSNGLDWAGFVDIPLGIDWRLCKWQRPEVMP
jgi:hypothetical protein